MHRDLKPGNILMCSTDSNDLSIKLSDFGFSSFYDTQQNMLGTPIYMAPEIFKKKKYTSKVDIWSIGIITYKLLVGKSPFHGISKFNQLEKTIKKEGLNLPQDFINNFSEEAVDFIQLATNYQPKLRPTARQLLKHPWIHKFAEIEDDCVDERLQAKMLTQIAYFSQSTKFVKIIVSVALGLNFETMEERNKCERMFKVFDVNQDGNISL